MNKLLLTAAASTLVLAACTNEYTPSEQSNGEEMFKAACISCHKPVEGRDNIYYQLSADKMNQAYIEAKITNGSLMMPKFPNLTGEALQAVSQYALEHSAEK